jgi:hypothetical protein
MSHVNLNNLAVAVVRTKYFVWSACYLPPLPKNLIKGEHQHVGTYQAVELIVLHFNICKVKVKFSPLQALEALRVVRG